MEGHVHGELAIDVQTIFLVGMVTLMLALSELRVQEPSGRVITVIAFARANGKSKP